MRNKISRTRTEGLLGGTNEECSRSVSKQRTFKNLPRRPSAELFKSARGCTTDGVQLPEPLTGGRKLSVVTLDEVPTSEDLAAWLNRKGLDTSTWGSGDTKTVKKYFVELELKEADLELWQDRDGASRPVRTVHVLRAKVCSPDSYEWGVFLFNTWQQFGDSGRKRIRNGLLSEKLSTSELPLEDHLHAVCVRAVCEEEMAFLVDAATQIEPGYAAPEYDPNEACPLKVVSENFVDHTVEIEISKSYPGLLTMYHLYTVDVLVENLPIVDFNTLEFDHPEKGKTPKLKYIHAWSWLEWRHIQRYLFEGSALKVRKAKGSFENAADLNAWLSQFALPMQVWGTGKYRSINDLFKEVEGEQSQLELWSRQDGVPLLMRVVHVLQLKLQSDDERQESGKVLFQTWQQDKNGIIRTCNRFLSKKIRTANVPFDNAKFQALARETVHESLGYIADNTYRMRPGKVPTPEDCEVLDLEVKTIKFEGHHFDLEESPTYKGMHTMYHLYTMEVECTGLPLTHFTTMNFKRGGPYLEGWRWVTWQETLDVIHAETHALERQDQNQRDGIKQVQAGTLLQLSEQVKSMISKVQERDDSQQKLVKSSRTHSSLLGEDAVDEDALENLQELAEKLTEELTALAEHSEQGDNSLVTMLPPCMVSKMAEKAILAKDTAEFAGKSAASSCEQFQVKQPQAARRPSGQLFISGRRLSLSRQPSLEKITHVPPVDSQLEGLQQATAMMGISASEEYDELFRDEDVAAVEATASVEQTVDVACNALPRSTAAARRDAAKAAFLENAGADATGLIERSSLMKVIEVLCPSQAAQAQALLDMVGPANSQKVHCAAFLDYVFAD